MLRMASGSPTTTHGWPVSQGSNRNARSSTVSSSVSTQKISSTCMSKGNTLYDVLGVSCDASSADIKAAYRRLARCSHPDVVSRNDLATTTKFIEICEAYSTLADPKKRSDYDIKIMRSVCVSQGCRNTKRTWETDQCW